MKRLYLALGLACLVCCLALILPLFGAAGFAGLGAWAGGLNWLEIACAAAIAGVLVAVALMILRRRRADGPTCDVRE